MPVPEEDAGVLFHFHSRVGNGMFGFARIIQVGELEYEVGFNAGGHDQWCYELSYIISGEGTFNEGNSSVHVQANDVVLNGKSAYHSICSDCGQRLRFMYLGFDIPDAQKDDPGAAELLQIFNANPNLKMRDLTGIGDAMRRLVKEYYNTLSDYREMVELYLRICLLLVRRNALMSGCALSESSREAGQSGDVVRNDIGQMVYHALQFIDSSTDTCLTVNRVAEKVGYNVSYLSHIFHEKTGMTIQQYIRKKRMEKAAAMLSANSIEQTARILGYSGSQTFSKAFSAVYGVTPSVYIRMRGDKGEYAE